MLAHHAALVAPELPKPQQRRLDRGHHRALGGLGHGRSGTHASGSGAVADLHGDVARVRRLAPLPPGGADLAADLVAAPQGGLRVGRVGRVGREAARRAGVGARRRVAEAAEEDAAPRGEQMHADAAAKRAGHEHDKPREQRVLLDGIVRERRERREHQLENH